MEIQLSIMIGVFFVNALLMAVLRMLNWVWLQPKKMERRLQQQGLKGNPYKLLYGDIKRNDEMLKEAHSKPISFSDSPVPRVMPMFHEALQIYGKITYVWLGPKVSVLLMDPEDVKEVMLKYNIFQKPHYNPLADYLLRGLVGSEGEKWAKHRKILNPAFHQEKLKHMIPAFHQSALELVSKWEAMVLETGLSEVDVWPHLQRMTFDAISRTTFGSNYEESKKIFEFHKGKSQLILDTIQSLYIPGWRFLPTKMNRRIKSLRNNVHKSIKNIIDARLNAMMAGKGCGDDLLALLLESNFKEIQEHGDKRFGLSIDDVIEECRLFYFAGQESAAALLGWTMIMLSKYPHWQTRAREEVLQLFGINRPDIDGLNRLKIVTMILNEVLRMYPAGAVLPRITTQDVKLGKLNLPAGVLVTLPLMLLNYDKDTWGEDANEFKPERFADGVSQATKGQLAFFPFGWGPRICIGQNFSMLEAKIALAVILQHFSFELSPSYSHCPISVLSLQPQYGAHLILHKV